jgi:hypothetical protein
LPSPLFASSIEIDFASVKERIPHTTGTPPSP